MGCKTLAGMMGVILATARSSIFLATARVSTLLKEQEPNYVGSKSGKSFIFSRVHTELKMSGLLHSCNVLRHRNRKSFDLKVALVDVESCGDFGRPNGVEFSS